MHFFASTTKRKMLLFKDDAEHTFGLVAKAALEFQGSETLFRGLE